VTDPHKLRKGLYHKFDVTRVSTGEPVTEFVFPLLPARDPLAREAIRTYIRGARELGFVEIADDLEAELRRTEWQ
jgi:hypothetical protein